MSFTISFLNKPVPKSWLQPGATALLGEIEIDDYEETISLSTDYWSRSDYTKQWVEGLERILERGESKSALVTEMYNPANPRFAIMWWVLYRDGDKVYIQNEHLIEDEKPRKVDLKNLYSYIGGRETTDEEGDEISEWNVSTGELKQFLEKLRSVGGTTGIAAVERNR